jgi:exopolysaccharide production protein ExoQ
VKELIQDPFFSFFISLAAIVYFYLLSHYFGNKAKAEKGNSVFIFFFLFLVTNSKLQPFSFLKPENLYAVGKGFEAIAIQLIIYAAFIFILRTHYKNFFHNLVSLFSIPFIGLFLSILLLSSIWSETPVMTFGGGLVLLGVSVIAIYIAKQYEWFELLRILCWNNALVAFLSVIAVILMPSVSTGSKGWHGIFHHAIDFGGFMAFGSIIWLSYALKSKSKRLLFLAVSIFLLALVGLANSAGAILAYLSLLLIFTFFSFAKEANSKIVIATLSLLLTGIIISSFFSTEISIFVLNLLGKEPTLTGRTEIWSQVWGAVLEKPVIGYGYLGFWQPWRGIDNPASGIINPNLYVPPHSHNGFLEILLDLGFVGFTVFVLSLVFNIYKSLHLVALQRDHAFLLPLLLITYLIILNLNQSSLLMPEYTWVYYIAISSKLCTEGYR